MPKKADSQKKSAAKTIRAVAKRVQRSAKGILLTRHALAKPVEIEPRAPNDSPLRALQKERKRLRAELQHQEMLAQDRPTSGNHMADDASQVEEQSKALALRHHLESMIQETDRAIARATKGAYGICEQCQKPISPERLKAMPAATRCIDCAKLQTRPTKVTVT